MVWRRRMKSLSGSGRWSDKLIVRQLPGMKRAAQWSSLLYETEGTG